MTPKKIPITSAISVITGMPVNCEYGYLILHTDLLEEEHSIIAVLRNEEIFGIPVATLCTDIRLYNSFPIFLGYDGQLWEYRDKEFNLFNVIEDISSPLRSIAVDGIGNLIIVGSLHQVYKSDNLNLWKRTLLRSSSITKAADSDLDIPYGLESVDSFNKCETYAVGWNGECFIEIDDSWKPISLPTNLDLYKVICAPDEYVYICGDNGIVLKGRGNKWTIINNELTDDKLWGLSYFKSRIFVSSMYNLYEIIDESLVPLQFNESDEIPPNTYLLSACTDTLWSIGERNLYQFDGEKWKQLISFDE